MTNANIRTASHLDLTLHDSPVGDINEALFGHIVINKFGAATGIAQADQAGLSFIRFPGGTLAERALIEDGRIVLADNEVTMEMLGGDRTNIAYDITHPELIADSLIGNDTGRPSGSTLGVSEVMQEAIARDQELNLIIPVQRYFIDQDFTDFEQRQRAIDQAVSDVRLFVGRLRDGSYNDGNLPKKLLFDIGNEPYWNPFEYAVIAKHIIDTLDQELAEATFEYEIGFQMGRGTNSFRNLQREGYFDSFFYEDKPALLDLEDSSVPPHDQLTFDERITYIDEQMLHILGDSALRVDYVRHHHLAVDTDLLQDQSALFHQRQQIVEFWTNAISSKSNGLKSPDYFVSAWTTDGGDFQRDPFTLANAVDILETFRNFAETGVDRAALWGLVGVYDAASTQSPTVISDYATGVFTPQMAILGLLSNNIIDAELLGSGADVRTRQDSSEFLTYTFESETRYTVFVAAGEIEEAPVELSVSFSGVEAFAQVEVTNLDMVGSASPGAARLSTTYLPINDGNIKLSFDQKQEIAMIVIGKEGITRGGTLPDGIGPLDTAKLQDSNPIIRQGDQAKNSIIGTQGADVLFGLSGDDTLTGGTGRHDFLNDDPLANSFRSGADNLGDYLFGGHGSDVLIGNDGDDWLDGGEGDDLLMGGGGSDTFVFRGGRDTINDYNLASDKILVQISQFEPQTQQYEARLTEEGNHVLDFGLGNMLVFENFDPVGSVFVIEFAT